MELLLREPLQVGTSVRFVTVRTTPLSIHILQVGMSIPQGLLLGYVKEDA